jgi:hypothetical protein
MQNCGSTSNPERTNEQARESMELRSSSVNVADVPQTRVKLKLAEYNDDGYDCFDFAFGDRKVSSDGRKRSENGGDRETD